jgi:predicted CoA-binding protein
MSTLESINEFLGLKRIAIVGVSRNPQDFTRQLFQEFRRRGYDAVPVNPNLTEVDGLPCYASVAGIPQAVDGVLLMTKPSVTGEVVLDCARAGVRSVWMHRGSGAGAVDDAAVKFCEAEGMHVVAGECPFMFFPQTGFIHKAHGFCRKIFGGYPS